MSLLRLSLFLAGLASAALPGQVPAEDSRNTIIRHTGTHFTLPVYKTLADWEARKAHLQRQILSAAGLFPMPEKKPLNPQIFGRLDRDGYTIEKVFLETLPGYYLGGNLYRPGGAKRRFPGVLHPHGHGIYGRVDNGTVSVNLARQGYVVLAYDMVGWNDTIQTSHEFGGQPREQLWSFGPLGLQLWNSMRAVDFLLSLEYVDPEQISVAGPSGGGTQTFLLTAVDDRVKYSAPVCMVSATMQGGCPCENAPNLRLDTFNVEIAALAAPRPMRLVSATGDWTRNTPKEEFPAIQQIYRLYGKAENVDNVHNDAPHNYNQASREAVYRFFGKHILKETDEKNLSDKSVDGEKLQDVLVLHGRALPANALTYEQLFAQWRAMARRQFEETRDLAALRQRLTYSLGAEWPSEVLTEIHGEQIVLSRRGRGDRVPGLWLPGRGSPVLVVHPQGAGAARNTETVTRMLRWKRPVLLIDAFQTGAVVAARDRSHHFFLTFNQSDDACRVQDILTALRFFESKQVGKPELVGLGRAGVWCLFAAAAAPIDLKLSADLEGFAGRDDHFIGRFLVPGIQRAGGLNAALRLTEKMR